MANKLRYELELDSQGYKQGAEQASYTTKELKKSTEDYIKSFGPLKKQLASAKREAEDLAGQFAALGRAEKQSEFGKELKGNLDFAIAKATELQDVLNDTRDAIKRGASDTQAWDALKEGIDIAKSATMAYASAVSELTGNEQDLAKMVKTLTTIENTFNTVIKIGNALQEQSNIILGIKKIQKWAAAVAEDMETKAKVKNTAATTANTAAETANAAATSKATAAVAANAVALNTNRSMLQKVFSTIGKAHPYVLLGGVILTATAAVGGYILATSKSSAEEEKAKRQKEKLKKAQEELKKSTEEFIQKMSSTFGELMSKYNNLRNAWNRLSSDHEKAKWIKNNKKELDELGLSVKNVHDAENVFEKNTGKVVDGFKKRAEAAAYSARMTSLYTRSLELEAQYLDRYNLLKKRAGDVDRSTSHTLDANGETYNNGESTYNKMTGQFELTAKGAAKANKELTATDKTLIDLNDDWKEVQNQINLTNNRLINLQGTIGGTTDTASKATEKQITELQKLIDKENEYKKAIENVKDPTSDEGKKELQKYKKLLEEATKKRIAYQIDIDYNVNKDELENAIKDIDKEISNINKEKVNIEVSIEDAKKRTEELQNQIDELENKKLEIDVSTEEGQNKVDELQEQIDELETEKLEVDASIALAQQKLTELQNQLDSLTGEKNKYTVYIDVKFPTDPVDKYEKNLKEQLDKAAHDYKLAKINGDEAAAKVAADTYKTIQSKLDELKIDIKPKVDKNEVEKIMKGLNTKDVKYDFSMLPDNFKQQAEDTLDRLNKIKDARQKLQDIIDKNESTENVERARTALESIEDEYEKLTEDAEAFNEVASQIKERTQEFESFKNTISDINNIVGAFDSIKSSIDSMINAFEEGKDGFEQFMAIFQTAMSIMNGVITIMETINTVQDIMNAKKKVASTTVTAEAVAHAANATAQGTEVGTTAALATTQGASIAPALGLAQAMEKLAAANIFAAHSYIPFVGPAIAAGFVGMMEAVIATVGKIEQFANGGIIEGNSYHGDKLIARVNSGEMIFNQSQQKRLLDIANGITSPNNNENLGNIKFIIEGTKLIGTINNTLKTNKKQTIG